MKALIWSIFHFVEAIVLARKLRDREIAHLHCHFANAGATVGMLAAHFERIPWSLTLHGISETDYPAGILLARKIARARFAACVSYFGQAQAMRVVPYDHWHKFFISRCGLDLEALPPKSSAARNRMRIICVGRLSPEKGHFGLLEAFRMALQQGVDAELVLVGTGPFERDLVSAVQSLELDRAVSFLGKLDEQRTLEAIASSDILVLASFMEGLPIVLMEAMALGVPVIGPRVAGTPELIEEGKEGLLFTPANWQELTARIVALAADKSLRSDLSQAARKKIEDDFRVKSAIAPLAKRFRILSTASS